jgi:glycosyltransferase involved in cell wall biosynthesis
MIQPLVSVKIITYNHEKYIAQCFEGVLMQKTDFPIEIIVGEDCSTDRTREIVVEYQKKYPDRIKAILSPTNLGGFQNVLQVSQACRGKYHASCEGDDYWIDPLKLQKQVNFMETHPECTMCFHNAFVVPEGNPHVHLFIPFDPPSTLTFAEMSRISIPTASRLARREVLASLPAWRKDIWAGDLLSALWCAHLGKVGYLKECMSVYRMHSEGFTAKISATPAKRFLGVIDLYQRFDQETGHQYTDLLQVQIERQKDAIRRSELGRFYFLLHPLQTTARLVQAVRKFINYRQSRGPNR